MLIWYKFELAQSMKLIGTFYIWLEMHKEFTSNEKNIMLHATYIPPVESPYFKDDMFPTLEEDINHFQALGHIVVCGNINASTGQEPDTLSPSPICPPMTKQQTWITMGVSEETPMVSTCTAHLWLTAPQITSSLTSQSVHSKPLTPLSDHSKSRTDQHPVWRHHSTPNYTLLKHATNGKKIVQKHTKALLGKCNCSQTSFLEKAFQHDNEGVNKAVEGLCNIVHISASNRNVKNKKKHKKKRPTVY